MSLIAREPCREANEFLAASLPRGRSTRPGGTAVPHIALTLDRGFVGAWMG
jgi:hypothetical protein